MQTNETLGDILRKKAEATAAASASRAEAQIQEDARKAKEERQRVDAFFSKLRETITESITKDQRVPRLTMGDFQHPLDGVLGFGDFFHGPGMTQQSHPYYEVWQFFLRWAASQGLAISWAHKHSDTRNDAGFPEESWYELDVKFL